MQNSYLTGFSLWTIIGLGFAYLYHFDYGEHISASYKSCLQPPESNQY